MLRRIRIHHYPVVLVDPLRGVRITHDLMVHRCASFRSVLVDTLELASVPTLAMFLIVRRSARLLNTLDVAKVDRVLVQRVAGLLHLFFGIFEVVVLVILRIQVVLCAAVQCAGVAVLG